MNTRKKFQHRASGPSRTQQGQANEADINFLVARYLRTGAVDPRLASRRPIFGDFTFPDFQEMMNKTAQVQTEFRQLPSRLRSRFSNQPSELVRFVNDPANRPEAIKLGLLQPTEQEVDAAVSAAAAAKAAAARAAAAESQQIDLVDEAEKPKKKPKAE